MRPHEETWAVDVSGEAYCGAIVTTPGGAGVFAVSPCSPSDDWNESDDADAARAQLAAQAPRHGAVAALVRGRR